MIAVKHLMGNRRGSALTLVIVVLVVTFILVGAVATLAQANIKQAWAQEKGLQAYYAAQSGAEMAFEALWTTDGVRTLLKELKDKGDSVTYSPETITLPNDAGTAEVGISYTKTGSEEEVLISSKGEYRNITRSVTLKVFFEVDSDTGESVLKEMVWSK